MHIYTSLTYCRKLAVVCVLCAVFAGTAAVEGSSSKKTTDEAGKLLDLVQERAFQFFWKEVNPATGLVKDRANNFGRDNCMVASIASVGFGLAALPVGVERGWVDREKARDRALVTLEFLSREAEHEKGFYCHFLGMRSAQRASRCELSSIDTAILLAGAIVAREYFDDPKITEYVNQIYRRIDFPWMLNGQETFAMGWVPEKGFLRERWWDYNEGVLLVLLALGSPAHPAPPSAWDALRRKKAVYKGKTLIQSSPLFTHQYPQLFFDLRGKHDRYADYFENSKNATICNYEFCMSEAAAYQTYAKGYWGLTACDSPFGYKAYGARPGSVLSDGTVAPTAALGSMMFTPELSIAFLQKLYKDEKESLWGKYGFCDAFNIDEEWNSLDVIGIDQGAIILSIENYRTGLIWKLFSQASEAQAALERAGFKPGAKKMKLSPPPRYRVRKMAPGFDWNKAKPIILTDWKYFDAGDAGRAGTVRGEIRWAWDNDFLYFRFDAQDPSVVSREKEEKIYLDDCLEIFVNPQGDGFVWKEPANFQIGFSPSPDLKSVKVWSWFKKEDPALKGDAVAEVEKTAQGYRISGKIRWTYLKIHRQPGRVVPLSPAFHDKDESGSEIKYNWHYVQIEDAYQLGELILE